MSSGLPIAQPYGRLAWSASMPTTATQDAQLQQWPHVARVAARRLPARTEEASPSLNPYPYLCQPLLPCRIYFTALTGLSQLQNDTVRPMPSGGIERARQGTGETSPTLLPMSH